MSVCWNESAPFINGSGWQLMSELAREIGKGYSNSHGYLALTFCIFGVVANVLHVRVLTSTALRSHGINIILAAIAVCDIGTVASYAIYISKFGHIGPEPSCAYDSYTTGWMRFIIFHSWLSIWLHSSSLWLSVLMGLFRVMTMREVTLDSPWSKPRRALNYISGVCISIALLTMPIVILQQIKHAPYAPDDCPLRESDSKGNNIDLNQTENRVYAYLETSTTCEMFKLNLWLSGIVYKLAPSFILVVLSVLLILKLRELAAIRKRYKFGKRATSVMNSTQSTTVILVTIVLVFVATEAPQGILTCLSAWRFHIYENIYLQIADILDLLSLINSSTNFVLYATMSSEYRRAFSQVILAPCCELMPCCSTISSERQPNNTTNANATNANNNVQKSTIACKQRLTLLGSSNSRLNIVNKPCEHKSNQDGKTRFKLKRSRTPQIQNDHQTIGLPALMQLRNNQDDGASTPDLETNV